MFPFFFGGYLCRINSIKLPLESKMKNSTLFLLLAAIIIALLLYFSSRTLHTLEFYNMDVWLISKESALSTGLLIGIRLILMFCAIIISFVIIENFRISNSLSYFGSATLVVYVIQGVFAHIVPLIAPQNMFIELGVAFLIISISVLLIKKIDCRCITNPLSTIIMNYNRNDNEDVK